MSYTTTLPSTRAWLSDPQLPGGGVIQCGTRRGGPLVTASDGELRLFAGNRAELVAFDSGTITMAVAFVGITGDALAQIKAWIGRTLLLRTTDGMRLYGGYLQVSQTTYLLANPVLYDAEVSFLGVTYSDTV